MSNKILTTIILLLTVTLFVHAENRRIVSLAASVTRNLYAIEAGDEIVGCTRFCVTDAKDSIPVVADAINVNMEKIVSLHPDIVIASGLTPPKVLEGLNRMGIRTERLKEPADFNEICSQCLLLGQLSGREENARKVVERSKARLEAIQARTQAEKAWKVFMEIGCDPLFSALPGSFMHDYIVRSGGKNIAEGLDNAMVSKEYVLLQNPDVILVVGMGIVGEDEIGKWKAVKSLSAAKKGKIYPLDQDICSPTPATFVDTVEKIVFLLTE